MIDPYELLERTIEGDADVLPVAQSGEFGTTPESGFQPIPGHPPKMFDNRFITMATNTKVTITVLDRPDYWLVRLSSTANGQLYAYPYEDAYGDPIFFEPSDKFILPGLGYDITLRNPSGVTITVQVWAFRGYDLLAFSK